MRATTIIGIGIAGIILYSLLTKASALKSLSFVSAGVSNFSFQGISPKMSLSVAVQNTSPTSLQLNNFFGSVYMVKPTGNVLIGNINSVAPQTIPGGNISNLNFDVNLSLVGAVSDLISMATSGNFSQNLQLVATANVDNYTVPIDLPFTV